MRNRAHSVVGIITILALASASCAGTSYEQRGSPPQLQTIDEFMVIGMDEFGEEAEQRALADLQNRIEGLLVHCMADQGLEYVTYERDAEERPVLGDGLTNSEFMIEYGYGVFTAIYDEARWNTEYPPEEVGVDPDVMWGEFTDDMDSYMAEMDECTDQIEEDLGRPEPGFLDGLRESVDEAWSPLEAKIEDMRRQLDRDSRLAEAEKDWSACMAGKGYDFATEEDLKSYLMSKLGEFQEGTTTDSATLTSDFEKDIQPFIDEEMAIAAIDVTCRGELDSLRQKLQREYEGWFIDDHRDELEKVREAEHRFMEVILEGWQW